MKDLDKTHKDTWERRKKNLNGFSYQEYLKSDHWANIKEKAKKRDNYKRCECCGHSEIELHHKSYKFIFTKHELKNIIALCRKHHQEIHDYAKENEVSVRIASNKVVSSYKSVVEAKNDDNCPNCESKLELREPKRKKLKANQKYYFTKYYYCCSCKYIKHDEKFKLKVKSKTRNANMA